MPKVPELPKVPKLKTHDDRDPKKSDGLTVNHSVKSLIIIRIANLGLNAYIQKRQFESNIIDPPEADLNFRHFSAL